MSTTALHPPGSFQLGVNLPWRRYGCDFGTNAWRLGGLAVHDCARIRTVLDLAAARGARVVRWFVFCDGRAGIRFAADGTPEGLQAAVFDDIARALHLVGQSGLRLVPVLFDFQWARPAAIVNGVQLGGRGGVLRNPSQRHALIDACVRPLVKRVGSDPRIAMWDLCNEPEWMAQWSWRHRRVSRRAVRTWLGELATAVRTSSPHPVTVGLASARDVDLCVAARVDVLQVHWYDRVQAHAPLEQCPSTGPLPCPVILGEFPSAGSIRSPQAILASARAAGYAGAWGWSLLAQDDASSREDLLLALASQ